MHTLIDTLSLYLAIANQDEIAVRQILASFYEYYELENKYYKKIGPKRQKNINCRILIERLMQITSYQYVDYLKELY
jgi:hypothetical protein